MTERWLPVPEYEGLYEVSDLGRVRSVGVRRGKSGKVLTPHTGKHDVKVCLSCRGQRRTYRMHTLVLVAFVGPRPPGLEACHLDGDCTNNRLSNLRWDTHLANEQDKSRHGTHHNIRKERCLRGHLLVAPNLLPRARGRQCRSCNAGRGAHRHSDAIDIVARADAFYVNLDIE